MTYPRSSLGKQDDTPSREADRQYMARIAQGDTAAFSALYDRLSGPLFSLACKMLGDASEAEDALQEACLQIWRRAATYDPAQSSVFSWAVLLTRGKIIDRLRARGRRLRVVAGSTEEEENPADISDASTPDSAADVLDRNDKAQRVRSILRDLPPEQREAIEMAFFSELTHHDIAQRLNQPLGTIKARIRRGLLQLRASMGRSL